MRLRHLPFDDCPGPECTPCEGTGLVLLMTLPWYTRWFTRWVRRAINGLPTNDRNLYVVCQDCGGTGLWR